MAKWTGDRPYDSWHWSQESQGKYRMGYTGYFRDNAQPDSRRVYDTYSPSWWEERGKVDAKAGKPSLIGWLRYDKNGVRYYVGDGAAPRVGDPPSPSAQEAAELAMRPAPAPSASDSAYLWGYLYAFISTAEPTFQNYPADSYEFWREQGLRDAFAFRPKRTAREISWRAEDKQLYYVGHGEDPTTSADAYRARLANPAVTSTTTTTTTDSSTPATTTTTPSGGSFSVQLGVPLGGLLERLFPQQPGYYPGYGPQYALPMYGQPGFAQAGYSGAYGYSGGYGGAPFGQPFAQPMYAAAGYGSVPFGQPFAQTMYANAGYAPMGYGVSPAPSSAQPVINFQYTRPT